MFAVIIEFNHKERETFVHYCQWKGNENEMKKLIKAIDMADTSEIGGDVSTFTAAKGLVPEGAVDAHVLLTELGNYAKMFQRHTGKFTCPDLTDDPVDIAYHLDKFFYACRLGDYFKK